MKFMIYSQDKEDGLSIRKANRDAHLAFLGTEALADVHEWLKSDTYAKAGLPASVTVLPFIWALGAP